MGDYTRRVGKTMPFTDDFGNTYENSFWALSETLIDAENMLVVLTFRGSVVDYNSDKKPLAQKQYFITGSAYDNLIIRSTNLPSYYPEIARDIVLAWAVASEVKDVPNGTEEHPILGEDGNPVLDESGNPKTKTVTLFKSFFEEATNIA